MTPRALLTGIRVVETTNVVAGPFTCALLADMGAEVIKIEKKGTGDPGRAMGPAINGSKVWFGVTSRNKKCITLDLKDEADRAEFSVLLRDADVLVENFRPGVMDRLGYGWRDVHASRPSLIMLSISGFGQTGPYAKRPGFGKIAEAMSGMVPMTGPKDGDPYLVGFSLADTLAGIMGLYGVALALYCRDVRNGTGSHVDLALYEPLLRMLSCQFALRTFTGKAPRRSGSNNSFGWGMDAPDELSIRTFRCGDGTWIVTKVDRAAMDQLGGNASWHATLGQKIAALSQEEARVALEAMKVDAAPLHDGLTIARHPYFQTRQDVFRVHDAQVGDFAVNGFVPRGYAQGARKKFREPGVGEDNAEVLGAAR